MVEDPERTVRAIGRRIAEVRNERGLTQEEFAERFGCSLKYVQRALKPEDRIFLCAR